MNIWFAVLSYVLSFFVSTLVLVYLLQLPRWITQQPDLVREYYIQNAVQNLILDFFLVAFYLAIASFFIWLCGFSHQHTLALLTVVLTTIILSGSFFLYFGLKPVNDTFFSRWFHNAGWNAVVYDVILVASIFVLYSILYEAFTCIQ